MTRIVAALIVFICCVSNTHAQFLNGNFEAWQNGRPENWTPVDTMGGYWQGLDSTDNSSCFSYHADGAGPGAFVTVFLTNLTQEHQFGATIPDGSKAISFDYTHNCDPSNGYISVQYQLHLPSGITFANGSQLLPASAWRHVQLAIDSNPNPGAKVYAELRFRFSFANLSKTAAFTFDASIDNIAFDTVYDAGARSSDHGPDALEVFPNPAYQTINVVSAHRQDECVSFQLLDALGRVVLTCEHVTVSEGRPVALNISSLPSGLYTLIQNGTVFRSRISVLR